VFGSGPWAGICVSFCAWFVILLLNKLK